MSFAKSWLLPFSLGAASALALVWFGSKSYDDNSKRDSSVAARKKVYPTENTSNKNENDAKEEEADDDMFEHGSEEENKLDWQ